MTKFSGEESEKETHERNNPKLTSKHPKYTAKEIPDDPTAIYEEFDGSLRRIVVGKRSENP